MRTQILFKISILISLIGIFFLLVLTNFLEPKQINISEINNKLLDQKVKISGTIEKITDKQTFQILEVKDSTGKIDVLCNCKNNIKQNQKVIITGKIQEYKKQLQISADKIILT